MLKNQEVLIDVQGLGLSYGTTIIMKDLNFQVKKADIFIVMGVNGCGKSTLLKSMIGLKCPSSGNIFYSGKNFWEQDEDGQNELKLHFGVLYQNGALWSAMTVAENVALPLQLLKRLSNDDVKRKVNEKLAWVGLTTSGDLFPGDLSGGMRKRASLARAMVMDPQIIFFDEPSAGLDPLNARKLDDLILKLRDEMGATIVVITHELPSIFAIGNNGVFLDAQTKTIIAEGNPSDLKVNSKNQRVIDFLNRSRTDGPAS